MHNNGRSSQERQIICDVYTYVKIGIISSILIFLVCNTIYSFALPKSEVACILDKVMDVTGPINDFLAQNTVFLNALLITSSILIDFTLITSCAYWLLYSRSWRFLIVMLLFYGVRAIIQASFQLGFPEGYIWTNPGFPSLVVAYDKTNDFFYSGHVGMPIIAALEWKKNGFLWPFIGCILVCIIEGFTVLVTRTHYSIDIFAGIICAHYFFIMVNSYVKYLDYNSIIGMKEKREMENGQPIPIEYEKVEITDDEDTHGQSNGGEK